MMETHVYGFTGVRCDCGALMDIKTALHGRVDSILLQCPDPFCKAVKVIIYPIQ